VEALCFDVRQLVLNKLSLRDLARAARTCQEFQQAYVSRVVEERARLIALGKETYGDGMFCAVVRVFQRAMAGLDPCPGVESGPWSGEDATISASGDIVPPRSPASELGPATWIWKPKPAHQLLSTWVRKYLPSLQDLSCISLKMMSTASGGMHLKVRIGMEAPAATMGFSWRYLQSTPRQRHPVSETLLRAPGRCHLVAKTLLSIPGQCHLVFQTPWSTVRQRVSKSPSRCSSRWTTCPLVRQERGRRRRHSGHRGCWWICLPSTLLRTQPSRL
jgi:hypothetical protein